MGDQPGLGSSRLRDLFEAALQDYEEQTGIPLAKHPLAGQLQNCETVESVTAVLHGQIQAFTKFRGNDKIMKPLKTVLSVLHKISAVANIGQDIGLTFPPVKAIHTGLGVLLAVCALIRSMSAHSRDLQVYQADKGVIDSYDALVDLLELIEHFLSRLEIYTKIPPTVAMNEMIVKILVEFLSILALVTKQIEQGKPKKVLKEIFGEKGIEAVLQRIDRLTKDEARITAAQTLEVVYGLVQNMGEVTDHGKASANHVRKSLEIMQQLASGLNRSKRDSLQQDIFKWLSPPDPWKNHYNACNSRHRDSGAWFINGTFSEWKASEPSLLWVNGKPGAGKSVICSTIIEDVDAMRKAGLASLAFFYCDFREDQKKDLRGLLTSLLVQLCHQSEPYCDILSEFHSEHAKGFRQPSDDALVRCLKGLLRHPGQAPVHLIVDALDECPKTSATHRSPRAKVLNLIKDLIKSQFPNLRICVTSRPETDIKRVLDPFFPRCVFLHEERGQKGDLEEYIKSVINTHPENGEWQIEHKQHVIEVLTEKADGMFRWVDCQVDYICGCAPAYIERALDNLPMTLEETYQRTLREINGVDWEVTHRMFQFVAVASRPLRVEELAQLVAFDFEAGQTPIFDEGCRPKDPVYAVESKCSSFLAIVDGGHSFGKVVQFSHFSVKEFLTSTHLAGESDAIHRRYHVSLTPAHTLAARACLGILLHLDKNAVSSDSLKKWPLAEYAAEHWSHHARFKNVSRNVDDAVKRLFDPSKPHHLAVCVSIYDPESLLWGENRPAERPFPLLRTPLHYAALWGLDFIVDFLVTERPQDVQSRGPTDDATPLHLASKRGHVEVARLLIKHGADVMAQTKDGETPLHLAAQEGQVEVARMLTERRADVKALVKTQNKYGLTPLHLASVLGQEEVAGMLIERCADVMAESEYGFTPLHLASFRGQVGVACILIEHGAEAAAQDKDGETPLHLALQEGQVEVARMLIECGTDVEAKNKDGKTPLHLASIRGQLEVARMLIEREADVMAQNKDGETPLHLALQEGHVEVARILIGSGADVTAQNKYGLTPFHLATPGVHAEVTRIIFEHGANPVPKKPPMAKVASGNRILFIIGPLGTLLLVVAISFMFGLRRSNRHMV